MSVELYTKLSNGTDEGIISLLELSDRNLPGIDQRVTRLEEKEEGKNITVDDKSIVMSTERCLSVKVDDETMEISDNGVAVKNLTATGSTTARALADRFADVINVKDFGAIGDGVVDDTEALNAALVAATGKVLYIPTGTYLTSTGLRIPAHTCVRGDGPWSTIIKLTSDKWETPCITNACNTTPAENTGPGDYGIRLENICADGNGYRANGSGSANHNGSAISWKNVHDLVQTNTRAVRGRLHCLDIASATYNNYYDADTADWTVGASTDVYVENFWGEDACTDDCLTTHYSGRLKFINCHLSGTKDRPYEKTFNQCGVEIDDGSYDVEIRGAYVTGFSWGIASKAHNENDPSTNTKKPAIPAKNIHFYDCVSEGNVVNWRVVNLGTTHNVGTTSIHNCKSITPLFSTEVGAGADGSSVPTHLYFSGRTDGLYVSGFLCVGDSSHLAARGIKLYPTALQPQDAEKVELRDIHFENVHLNDHDYDASNDTTGLISMVGSWRVPCVMRNISSKNCSDNPVIRVTGNILHDIKGAYGFSSTTLTRPVLRYNTGSAVVSGLGKVSDISHTGYVAAVQVGSQFIPELNAGTYLQSTISEEKRALFQSSDTENTARILTRYCYSSETGGGIRTGLGAGIAFARSDYAGLQDDAWIWNRSTGTSSGTVSDLVFSVRTQIGEAPSNAWMIRGSSRALSPWGDNVYSLGTATARVSEVYAGTASINTSDAREKTFVADPDEALMRAWSKVNFKSFQFIDAVEKKGTEDARIHFGVIAQQVQDAFASEGLDASRYALFCHDKWDDEYEDVEIIDVEAVLDENGNEIEPAITHIEKHLVTPAGDRYGIRYSEALALECAYQRWRIDKLEAQLNNK